MNVEIGPSYHFGHLMLEYMKRHSDIVGQIDAATGGEETYSSILSRSIRLARSLREFGLNPGDILAIGGRNHLDLHIPFYAAIFNGLPIVGVDPLYKYDEVLSMFKITKPKIAFCQNEHRDVYAKAAATLGLEIKMVTFTEGECTLSEFIEKYDNGQPEQDFKAAEFDIEEIYAFLVSTSGTTGSVKVAAFKHKPFLTKILSLPNQNLQDYRTIRRVLNLSPVQWITSYFFTVFAPITGVTLVQTSLPDNYGHIIDMVNKYKPVRAILSPTLMSVFVSRKNEVDLSCFRRIDFSGSKIYSDVFLKFKELTSNNTIVSEAYGLTEMIGTVLAPNPLGPIGSCGRPVPSCNVKLVDPESGVEIKEPHVTGELLAKGLRFTEYYNDPVETALVLTEDGYFKTGDLMYRDENNNYFFVDRVKTLIKYRNSHVIPSELEAVILEHPGVQDACIVGKRDAVDGEQPLACVVRKSSAVTAQEIKDLVANKLSKNKELRGGVVFLESLPYTSTGKILRRKVLEMVENLNKE